MTVSGNSTRPFADSVQRLEHSGDVVRLVQVTDTHLCESRGGTLLGMDTDQSLRLVLDAVDRERGKPDLALLTGDLSDQGAASAYARMVEYGAALADECFWLPGNHDDRRIMAAALEGSNCLSREIRIAGWQIVLLDSQVPGEVGGELGPQQLALLEGSLSEVAAEGLFTLVCMHHHPVKIGCAWLDEQIVTDAKDFFDVIDRYDGVRGVLWGHIHQRIDRVRKGVKLMGSPSTCVQFAPGSDCFKADDLAPGYRWLDLHADGRIDTDVSRVDGSTLTVNLDSKGYL